MKKKVVLSFDYELFFGNNSGTVKHSIIEPTYRILDSMERVGLKGNFFVDTLMIKYLSECKNGRAKHDLIEIENQLKDIVRRGHRIELHLHPHWIDAKYKNDGTWDFSDFSHYSLTTLDSDTIYSLVISGTEYLNSIARQVNPTYSVCAFRAGGWAIEPFDLIKDALSKANIKIDSSAAYGFYFLEQYRCIDFRDIPNKPYYKFSTSLKRECVDGDFVEIPITTYKHSYIELLISFISRFMFSSNMKRLTDGTHSRGVKVGKKQSIFEFHSALMSRYCLLSFSQTAKLNAKRLLFSNPSNILCYIDHPKDLNANMLHNIAIVGKNATSILYSDFFDL